MIDVSAHKNLAEHTSWKVGGPAEYFFQPESVDALAKFLKELPNDKLITWVGLGSNILIRDKGVKGVVIATFPALNNLQMQDSTVIAQAGVACAQAARFSARHHLTGLEFLAGIPGTIGGALAMNAGCHDGETWSRVKRVEMINRQGDCYYREPDEFTVAYREVKSPVEEWFVSAEFSLQPGEKATSLEKIRELLARRATTQPTNLPSCGSVFRNPPDDYAARLIEAAGLKGFSIGGAEVSPKHANFIVNTGAASAADIESLIKHIERVVLEQFGVKLLREVKIIGEV
jgi:UDP-N-acetylmuramate dehydrogenase